MWSRLEFLSFVFIDDATKQTYLLHCNDTTYRRRTFDEVGFREFTLIVKTNNMMSCYQHQ